MEPEKQGQDQTPPPAAPNQLSFLWLSAAIFLMFLWLQDSGQPQQQELAYSEFKEAVLNGQVSEVTLQNEEIRGQLTDSGSSPFSSDPGPASRSFITVRPPVEDTELRARPALVAGPDSRVPALDFAAGPDVLVLGCRPETHDRRQQPVRLCQVKGPPGSQGNLHHHAG